MSKATYIILALTFSFIPSLRVTAQHRTGTLKGFVADKRYARVARAILIFENSSFRKEIEVNREGAYEVELPAGTYRVRAQSTGFYSREFNFAVKSGFLKTLNLTLYIRPPVPIKWICPKSLRPCIIE